MNRRPARRRITFDVLQDMKTRMTILLAIALTQFGGAEVRVDQAIIEIFADHAHGEKILPKRVYDAMEQIILKDYRIDGDLKAAVAEINRQHPKLFLSFGASKALSVNLPRVLISEKAIGLKTLMDRLAKAGNCRWEYTVGKGLRLHFTKNEERDVGVIVGL